MPRAAVFGGVATLLVTALTLGAVEIVLRAIDYPQAAFSPWVRSEKFGFRLAPGIRVRMRGPEYDVEVATNSLGMRDDEPRPQAHPRVLLLGDSFAMGYGVERGRIFADRLEADLGVEVVNAGTGGYEIVQQPRVLAEYGPALKPDLVLYALYLGNDLAQNDEWEVLADGTLRSRVRQYPLRRPGEIKLVRLARDFLYGIRQGRSAAEGEWLPFSGYLDLCETPLGPAALADYDDAEAHLVALAAEAQHIGAPLLVVELPYRSMVEPAARAALASKVPGLAEKYDLTRPAREMGARMDRHGIAHADATPFLVEEFRREGRPLFFPIDGHLTETGHEAVARFLLPRVRERLAARP